MARLTGADLQQALEAARRLAEDDGVMDYVVIAGLVRSPMGRFQTLFSDDTRWWGVPKEEDLLSCRAAAVDPFFRAESDKVAEICIKLGIPAEDYDIQDNFGQTDHVVDLFAEIEKAYGGGRACLTT